MKQADFQQIMQGTNAIYNPFVGTGARYELKSISAKWRAPNPRILVLVIDEGGAPLPGVSVKNVYPGGQEAFTTAFAAIEFNLGEGSKTPVGEPGPHEIVVGRGSMLARTLLRLTKRGADVLLPCDVVKGLGIPNEGHDGYIEFALVYQRVSGSVPPPPPSGDLAARVQAIASQASELSSELFSMEKRLDEIAKELAGK